MIGVDQLAARGDHAEAVAVAVEGQADIGAGLLHGADQVLEVLGLARVRMVVGEGAVDLGEQRNRLGAEALDQRRAELAGHAVAAVDHRLERAGQGDVTEDALEVGLAHVLPARLALALGEITRGEAGVQCGDGLAGERLAAQHDLEAVVVRRVVAAGDHHAGSGALDHVGGEVEHRGGDHADVDDVAPGRRQAPGQGLEQSRPREAPVAGDDHGGFAAGEGLAADGAADLLDAGLGQGVIDDAADVVGAEDRGGYGLCGHGIHPLWGRVAQRRPELPKPPSPRWLASKSSTISSSACTTGTSTYCASRSKGSRVKGAWPRFQVEIISSPW